MRRLGAPHFFRLPVVEIWKLTLFFGENMVSCEKRNVSARRPDGASAVFRMSGTEKEPMQWEDNSMNHKGKKIAGAFLALLFSLLVVGWVVLDSAGLELQDLPVVGGLWEQETPAPATAPPEEPGVQENPEPPQEEPLVEEPVTEPEPEPEEPACYDFSQPAPETEPVENDYFKDAAFVGDSRTDGFLLYSGIKAGKNLTSNGLSIFQLKDKKVLTIGGEKYTLLEALAMGEYSKVYLSLGVNELGFHNDEGFYQGYCEAIDIIRSVQPNAIIYIQGLIPLNEGVIAQTIKRDYLRNDRLRTYNQLMRKAAEEKQVVFLDLYSAFVDENEELPADASRDGVHLSKEYCQMWLEYLRRHTVDADLLTKPEASVEAVPEEAAQT